MKITTKLNKNYIYFYLSSILYRQFLKNLYGLNDFNEFDEIHIFENTASDNNYSIDYILKNNGRKKYSSESIDFYMDIKDKEKDNYSYFDRKKLWDKEEHIYDYDDLMKNKILVRKTLGEVSCLDIVDINDLNYKNMKNSRVWCVEIFSKDFKLINEIEDKDNILIGDNAVESLEEYIKYYDIDTYYTLQLFSDPYIKLKNDKDKLSLNVEEETEEEMEL